MTKQDFSETKGQKFLVFLFLFLTNSFRIITRLRTAVDPTLRPQSHIHVNECKQKFIKSLLKDLETLVAMMPPTNPALCFQPDDLPTPTSADSDQLQV